MSNLETLADRLGTQTAARIASGEEPDDLATALLATGAALAMAMFGNELAAEMLNNLAEVALQAEAR